MAVPVPRKIRLVSGGPVTPQRAALTAAIAALADADRKAAAAIAGQEPAQQQRRAAEQAVAAAKAGVEEAKAAAAAHLSQVALGAATAPPRSISEARAALADAEDTLASWRQAEEMLGPIIAEAASRRPFLETARDNAVRDVVASELATAGLVLARRLQHLQRELIEVGDATTFLADSGALPVVTEHGTNYGRPADLDIRHALLRLSSPPNTWRQLINHTDGAASWRAAIAALKQDANAALPTMERS